MGKFLDIKGETFNEWTVIEYVGDGFWKCKCSCGNEKILEGRSVRKGRTKSCGHGYNEFKDITGKISGDFEAIEYIGNKVWKCQCIVCKKEKKINRNIFTYEIQKCNHRNSDGTVRIYQNRHSDKIGKIFGDFEVLEYDGDGYWNCKCTVCNKTRRIQTYALSHSNNRCNHVNKGDSINDWTIIKLISNSRALCKCICGVEREVAICDLLNNKSKSCGHDTSAFKDLKGQQFGNWKVLEYEGNGYWKCECQCEKKTISNIHSYSLRSGNSRSCGCIKRQLSIETKLNKYGELNKNKVDKPRELWQIHTLNDKELLEKYITDKVDGITVTELAEQLNVNYSTMLQKLKKFDLDKLVNIQYNISSKEKELLSYIRSIYSGEIITNKIGIIPYKELDIYIPEKKIAIEFNGTYWHSTEYKYKNYHQQKTIACAKQGIRLIHVFEYEWDTEFLREKIKNLLANAISNKTRTTIYARNTYVAELSYEVCASFLNSYHLQGNSNSSINIGCFKDNILIGVMTFGKPRFNSNYEYELHRFCWDSNYEVKGGAEKMFSYFINKYNSSSIITYTDISKFTGNVYTRIGFKPIQPNPITEPNYIWVEPNRILILNRYQTMKHKLVEQGLGTEDQTEDEIMKELNFLKVYDSGNLRLAWYKDK